MSDFEDDDIFEEDSDTVKAEEKQADEGEDRVEHPEIMEIEAYEDFYQKLRAKVKKWLDSKSSNNNKWTQYLVAAPDLFYMMFKLVQDETVESALKVKLVFALAYFISPFDLIPEAVLGVAGYIDDIALAAYVLNDLMHKTDEALIRRYWLGEGDVLSLIRRIINTADDMLGSGLYKKLLKAMNK